MRASRLELDLEALEALTLTGALEDQVVERVKSMPARRHMDAALCLAKTSHLFSGYLLYLPYTPSLDFS